MKKIMSAIVLLYGVSSVSAECLIGEIKIFSGNFAPRGWALAQGQMLNIAQNTALFSILGTTYGGNGRTTFALPDLRGRSIIGTGQGPGLQRYALGQKTGVEAYKITVNNMPASNQANLSYDGLEVYKEVNVKAAKRSGENSVMIPVVRKTSLQAPIQLNGSSAPVNNMQPSLAMNHIVCMYGIYPSRN